MSKYRNNLPQLTRDLFLTDGGLETTLIFHNGIDLPYFAAFDLLKDEAGTETIRSYYHTYVQMAKEFRAGFVLESPTWRASADWGDKLGYSSESLAVINRKAIKVMQEIRDKYESNTTKIVISGCVGPRGDGYNPSTLMTADEAEQYHAAQIAAFREAGADMVSAITMNYGEEAIGITRAATAAGMPVAISFTVETDGNLPTGQSLKDAIETVDQATDNAPAYYMINCAHPQHFENVLVRGESWLDRIRGLRANASTKSHAELDEAEELDAGNPIQLGAEHRDLVGRLKNLNILGGCCGTDHRHVDAICKACIPVM